MGKFPTLSDERCRSLLASASSGHLALSRSALPLVVPVTCVLDGDALLVRARLGLVGKVPPRPGVVAFETAGREHQMASGGGKCLSKATAN